MAEKITPQAIAEKYPKGALMRRIVDGKEETRQFGQAELVNQLIYGRKKSWGWELAEEKEKEEVKKPAAKRAPRKVSDDAETDK